MRLHVIVNGPNFHGVRNFPPVANYGHGGRSGWRNRLGTVLVVVGAVAVVATGLTWVAEAARESYDRSENLAHVPKAALPNPDAPVSFAGVKPGSAKLPPVLGVLNIDRVGLSVLVRPGDDAAMLASGAGWIPGTSLPGQMGNVGISGHRDTFFRKLEDVRIGDTIALVSDSGRIPYVVRETKVVSPDEVGVLKQTSDSTLTLVTCYPFQFIGPAPKRYIIRATNINAKFQIPH